MFDDINNHLDAQDFWKCLAGPGVKTDTGSDGLLVSSSELLLGFVLAMLAMEEAL